MAERQQDHVQPKYVMFWRMRRRILGLLNAGCLGVSHGGAPSVSNTVFVDVQGSQSNPSR